MLVDLSVMTSVIVWVVMWGSEWVAMMVDG